MLLGLVGIVALVAVLLAVRIFVPAADGNLVGHAAADPLVRATVGQEIVTGIALDAIAEGAATVGGNVLRLGDSVAAADAAITLMSLDGTEAGFLVVPAAAACDGRDAQTPYCRGASACCGGTCMLLPACQGRADGPAGACGARDLHCCDGALRFTACGDAQ